MPRRLPTRTPLRFSVQAMGTRFELALPRSEPRPPGPPGGARSRSAEEMRLVAAAEEALAEIEEWDRRLSRFRCDSLVSHLQARCAVEPVVLDEDTYELFAESLEVHRASGGAFDITLAERMLALGFWGDESSSETRHPGPVPIVSRVVVGACGSPDDQEAQPLRSISEPVSRMNDLVLDPATRSLAFARPGVALDLGAIGKGQALDRAAELLRAAGVESALLHGGTSAVLAIGAPPDQAAWRVAIRIPGRAPALCELRDAALGVSAPHGRSAAGDGRCTHVLDPRSGAPARRATLAAVIGPSARTADAWSTALIVDPEAGALTAGPSSDWTALVVTPRRPAATGRPGGLSAAGSLDTREVCEPQLSLSGSSPQLLLLDPVLG